MAADSVAEKLLFRKDEAGATNLTILADQQVPTWQLDAAVDDGLVVPGDVVFGLNVSVNVHKIVLGVMTGSAAELSSSL